MAKKGKTGAGESTPSTRMYRGRALRDQAKSRKVSQRKSLRAQKQRQQKRQQQNKTVRRLLLTIVLAAILLFALTRLFIFGYSVDRDGIYDQNLTNITGEYLSSPWRRFKPLFSSADYSKYVLEKDPSVVAIEASLPLFSTTLSAEVASRAPDVVWVDERRALAFLVDSEGIAYDNLLGIVPGDIKIIDTSGVAVSLGDGVMSPQNITFIKDFNKRAGNNNLSISSYSIGDSSREIHVRLTDENYFIKLTTNRSAKDQLQDIVQARKFIKTKNEQVKQYIDVRVADKVFYK